MHQPCTVCAHGQRALIEQALLSHSLRHVAQQFGPSPWALHRHKRHTPGTAIDEARRSAAAQLAAEAAQLHTQALAARDLFGYVQTLRQVTALLVQLARITEKG
jgi:hypothetical protein